MKYLVTGANGFLGQHICQYLESLNIDHRAVVRTGLSHQFSTGDLTQFTNWNYLFKDIHVVIHAAAKAHDMSKASDLIKTYQTVNFEMTVQLAEQAKKNGVKKFIFISTVKVNGENSQDSPFKADDSPNPTDPYSISKHQAEQALLKMHQPGIFEICIIRPCLIYGTGVKANFSSLMKLAERGFPLPFGLIKNKRSIVSVYNLINLIMCCSKNSQASGNIFMASDGIDLSLAEIIKKIALSMGKKTLMLPVPISIMSLCFALLNKKDLGQRLFSNLQVDITKNKTVLNWEPPYTTEQSLNIMTTTMTKGN